MKYYYFKNICEDIKEYLNEHYNGIPYYKLDFDEIYEKLWVCDQITGNASGSYWFSSWDAEEALCHNLDLMFEAFEIFGTPTNFDPETADVTIRCYLLDNCLRKVLYNE